jgi:hypothetical protein
MFIITIAGKEDEGAYSVKDEFGEKVLYIFEDEDDATRFAMMLEDRGTPEMYVMEVEEHSLIQACEMHDHKYQIFTVDDFVIPPE